MTTLPTIITTPAKVRRTLNVFILEGILLLIFIVFAFSAPGFF